MIKMLLVAAIILWLAWTIYRAVQKTSSHELQPAPEGACKRLNALNTTSTGSANVEQSPGDFKEADLSEFLGTPEFRSWTVVSASIRPDGKYAAAIMYDEDPDMPMLCVVDLETGIVKRFDSTELIDWPGEQIVWQRNDFSPLVFDEISGYSQLIIDYVGNAFVLTPLECDNYTYLYDEWFLEISHVNNDAYWTRVRTLANESIQTYTYNDYGGPRYSSYRKGTKEFQYLNGNCVAIWDDESGKPMVDGSRVGGQSQIKEDAAEKIQELLVTGQIAVPRGRDEEEIGFQLRQQLA